MRMTSPQGMNPHAPKWVGVAGSLKNFGLDSGV